MKIKDKLNYVQVTLLNSNGDSVPYFQCLYIDDEVVNDEESDKDDLAADEAIYEETNAKDVSKANTSQAISPVKSNESPANPLADDPAF